MAMGYSFVALLVLGSVEKCDGQRPSQRIGIAIAKLAGTLISVIQKFYEVFRNYPYACHSIHSIASKTLNLITSTRAKLGCQTCIYVSFG